MTLSVVVMANGWHLGAIQLFAWANMALDNASSMDASTALSQALTGKEICGICVYVREQADGRDNSEAEYWQTFSKTLLAWLAIASICLVRPEIWRKLPESFAIMTSVFLDTRSPPPRLA